MLKVSAGFLAQQAGKDPNGKEIFLLWLILIRTHRLLQVIANGKCFSSCCTKKNDKDLTAKVAWGKEALGKRTGREKKTDKKAWSYKPRTRVLCYLLIANVHLPLVPSIFNCNSKERSKDKIWTLYTLWWIKNMCALPASDTSSWAAWSICLEILTVLKFHKFGKTIGFKRWRWGGKRIKCKPSKKNGK